MAKVVYSAHVLATLEYAIQGARDRGESDFVSRRESGRTSIRGRRVEGDLRELVISYGKTGFIALYRFDVQRDEVRILALRHQREIGYLP